MWEFTRCLSAYYVDLDAPESALPLAPSFYRHFFRSPFSRGPEAADLTENFLPRMPHLAKDYDLTPLWQKYGANDAITNQVQLRLSGESIQKMFNEAQEENPSTGGGVKITLHDALSAYLIKALHQAQGIPMHTVLLILNVHPSLLLAIVIRYLSYLELFPSIVARVPTLPRLQPSTHPRLKEMSSWSCIQIPYLLPPPTLFLPSRGSSEQP